MHVWFVPEQIAWSREGTGLPSETLEGPLRRFTEFERGEVKFFPQPTVARVTLKKQQNTQTFNARVHKGSQRFRANDHD